MPISMSFMRYGAAGIAGAAGGGYLGGDTRSALYGAGVGVGGYALWRNRAGVKRIGGPIVSKMGGMVPQGVKNAFSKGGNILGKAFVGLEAAMIVNDMTEGRGMARDVYEAYKRNSPTGMMKGIAGSLGSYALLPLFFGPYAIALAPLVAAKEIYSLGETAREHHKRLRQVELGGGEIMSAIASAGTATMRQRSLLALQNTHINGRMAMGNEAFMFHTPFR